MARYFFHIRHGQSVARDLEGGDFPDLAHARAEATVCARELAAGRVRSGGGLADRFVEVTDQNGELVDTVAYLDIINIDA